MVEVETSADNKKAGIRFDTLRTGAGMGGSELYKSGSFQYWILDAGMFWNSNGRQTMAAENSGIKFFSSSQYNATKSEFARFDILTKRLGIGTTSPTELIEVKGETDVTPGVISLASSRNDASNVPVGVILGKNSSSTIAAISMSRGGGTHNGFMTFHTKETLTSGGPVERMRITESGSIGIGTSTPSEKLHVSGTLKIKINGDTRLVLDSYNGSNDDSIIDFRENSVNRALIYWDGYKNDFVISSSLGDFHLLPSGSVGIGTTTPAASLDVVGDIRVLSASLSYQENTDIDSTTATVATLATGSYDAGFFDYVAKNGTNLRAGTVTAIHSASIVQYNEVSTVDIGDTSDVKLLVVETGGNLALQATTTTNNWNIKALVRGL